MIDAKSPRMTGAARREQVLEAAARAFAIGGYAGTTTDDVAKEAGVSQPYVVRMFGGKAELFRQVYQRAIEAILACFDAELDRLGIEPADRSDDDELWPQLGRAYLDLVADRTVVLILLHGFSAGSEPSIAAQARDGMTAIYTNVRDRTGGTPDQVRKFIAEGMLLNILLSIQAPDHAPPGSALRELSVCAFGESLLEFAGFTA